MYHYARPLVLVEGDDLIGFCDVMNGGLDPGGRPRIRVETV